MAKSPTLARWRWCIVLVVVILVGAGVAALWKAPKPAATPPATPDDSLLVRSRTLQSGKACRVAVHAPGIASHPVEKLDSIEISLDGAPVIVPLAAFQDLREIQPFGIQIADFAGDIFLLIGGGPQDKPWTAKLTEHEGRIVRREFFRPGQPPKVTQFRPPPQLDHGIARPEEIAAALSQRPATTPRSP